MKLLIAALITISGVVKDADTNETLPAARIEILSENTETYTDFDGIYSIDSLPADTKIKVSYISYEDTVITVSDLKEDGIIYLDPR